MMKKAMTMILALAAALNLCACANGSPAGDETRQEPSTTLSQRPDPVPLGDFSALDFEGNPVTKEIFAQYDLTMVNLWTTTCGYCIEEMPVLAELRKEFQDAGTSFNIISICMDVGSTQQQNEANLEKAQQIIEKVGVDYPNLIPDSVLLEGRLKGVQAFPESFFVDSEGNVVSEPYIGAMQKNHWRVTMNNEIQRQAEAGKEA